MKGKPEVKVKSLQKALEILNCFTEKQPLGVTEISDKLELYKSNVHNILTTFTAMDYLEQDEETGKYKLGIGVFNLCRAIGDNYNILSIALPYMREIVKQVGEIAYLAVPYEDEVIYLDAVYPSETLRPLRSLMGERNKMYCTSVGKAMLANLPQELVDEFITKPKEQRTKNTITDSEELRKELQLTKERGYAFDNMELEYGIKCVGVPIFNRKGGLEGAMSISGPSLRLESQRVKEVSEILKGYAREIQKKL